MPGRTIQRRALLRACAAGGLLLAAPLLAACGGAGANTATTARAATASTALTGSTAATKSSALAQPTASVAAAPAGAPGSLSFWSMDDPTTGQHYKAWLQRIKDFNAANPRTPAEIVNMNYSSVNAKLPAVVAAGTPPNVAEQDRYTVAAGAARNLMQDISARANTAGVKRADQQPWAWQEVAIKGKLYGLPTDTDSRMVFYNVNQLQQAGLAKTAPKTLDDYAQVVQKLTVKQGDTFKQIGFLPWYDNWGLFGFGWLFGGSFYDAQSGKATLDDVKNIAALDWLNSQAKFIGYDPGQAFIKARGAQGNLFQFQAISTYFQASASVHTYLDTAGLEWGVWQPPPPQGMTHTSTWSGGFCVVLPAGAKDPDPSFDLMRYLSDATCQLLLAKLGLSLPTIKSVAADPYWNTVDPRVKQFVDILPYSHSRPAIPQINLMNTQLNTARTDVLSGKKGAAEALQEANQQVNLAIQQNRTS
ncbi:MAG TPA: extracellular solute-binding protein [Chloroflexota bacterium]|nr:extracellular solute-binding protein [Chloroflexota bacterium]